MTKYVYFFGGGNADGSTTMKNLLGGKGANLAEMNKIGLPVPAGFTITTEVCTYFYDNNHTYPPELKDQVAEALKKTEQVMGAKFGDSTNPLLLSCRSGARESMPGMMDTVLNIGLNETTLAAIIKQTGNERFGWDSYRRFIAMYGDVVLGMKGTGDNPFESILHKIKHAKNLEFDTQLTTEDLKEVVKQYKAAVKEHTGKEFPDEPMDQIWTGIDAVFKSWHNNRAIIYRRQYGIPHEWGTATNVQAMVFGNMGDDCCTGVAFTRDPATGESVFWGEYLINAQGEDVVAGIRTPKQIAQLKTDMPGMYDELEAIRQKLESHYKDMQDIEFTVQKNKVWMLQTRNGKRTGFAAVRIAVDMVDEGLIPQEEALNPRRVAPDALNHLLQPVFDPKSKQHATEEKRVLAKGINAGPGAATGRIKFEAADAKTHVNQIGKGKPDARVILVREETSPEDIEGMQIATGILTAKGGASSHAAVVSRQMGKVCVVGCQDLRIDYSAKTLTVGDTVLNDGDWISIDGFTGEVMAGQVETRPSEVIQVLIEKSLKPEESRVYQQFAEMMEWADKHRKLGVRTNADTPKDAAAAIAFGAEGIGLCRTEHMFFEEGRIDAMREMILADNVEDRKKALEKLLPYQREDFEGLFKAMEGLPVTIRALDPPLHEFLPHTEAQQKELASKLGVDADLIKRRVAELHESNPMLGHRGCRLGIVYPEITEMQCRAIFEAACNVKKAGIDVKPEVMIPLVSFKTELSAQEKIARDTAKKVFEEKGIEVAYLVGTMIELPRGCAAADQIAQVAEFFSFGTNDLTQTTLGISRDDYGTFMPHYLDNDFLPKDPFQSIDRDGVGEMMKMGVTKGRQTRPDIKLGICGEHGGDPDSVVFCHNIGLDYVSCSPFRVPVARLAAAQAALADKK
ncbi:MAG: pyruvate, phosphate dikinase [Gemmataceae bacterium]